MESSLLDDSSPRLDEPMSVTVNQSEESIPVVNQSEESVPVNNQSEESSPPVKQTEVITQIVNHTEESAPPVVQSEMITPVVNQSEESPPPVNESEESSPAVNQSEDSSTPVKQSEESSPPVNQSEASSPPVNQSEASTPPPSIVRSSDPQEESKSLEGGTGSVKSMFEKGAVSNITVTPTKQINVRDAPEEKSVSESTPVIREDVIRSSESPEDVKVTAGGIRNLKSMFEKGGVTNVQTRASKEPISVGSLEDMHESTDRGCVAESTPVIRADVIRSSDSHEDPGIQKGFSKSLKNRFETERISNIEEKPKEKIEMAVEEKRVYQQPERSPSREDIINAETQSEDPGIKAGQARSLRSLFEKGNVSNVEQKPRPTLERQPQSLDDFKSDSQVSESTPVKREDVVLSSSLLDEPMKPSESTKSMKQRWETGQVEHVHEKPKPELERKPQSLDNYSMTMVASENTPEERDDIVKSSSSNDDFLASKGGSPGSLRAKLETGDVQSDAQKAEKSEIITENHEGDSRPNGDVRQENGLEDEEEEEEQNEAAVDASWEIKAARAAAMAEAEAEADE